MKKIPSILIKSTIVISMFLSLSTVTYALADYTQIAPLPNTYKSTGCAPNETSCTNLETYIPNIFKLSIGIAAVLAFVMITVGGITYATADALANKQNGRKYIEDALWGLLLVIGAYVILNTINPKLLNFQFDVPDAYTPASNMTPPSIPSAGAQPVTSTAVVGLRTACGCSITITSTTGGSHDPNSLHYQGLAVDIKPDTGLNKYLTGQTNNPPACTVVTKTLNGVASRFLWEPKGFKCNGAVASDGDHWHMSVTP